MSDPERPNRININLEDLELDEPTQNERVTIDFPSAAKANNFIRGRNKPVMSQERIMLELNEAEQKRSIALAQLMGFPIVGVFSIIYGFMFGSVYLVLLGVVATIASIFIYKRFSVANNRYKDLKSQL